MPVPRSSFMRLVHAGCFCGLVASSSAHAAIPQAEYDALILSARSGQAAAAIDKLQAWHAANPEDRRIVYDLAAVLDMAGRYPAALEFKRQILVDSAPAYAIKAIAHAARASGRLQEAEAAYRLLIAKTPQDAEAHAGLVYTWVAQDRIQDALGYVVAHLPTSSSQYRRSDVPMIIALAELRERRHEWLSAASAYQDVLRFDPGFRYALRGRVFALANAGLPFLAQRLAMRHPDIFNDDEKYRLAHDAIAHTVRFGEAQIAVDTGGPRFATIDVALAQEEGLARRYGEKPIAQFDRLVALRDRLRMRDAVQLYGALRAAQAGMPAYAKLAAADAYLYLQQPEAARDLYLEALKELNAAGSARMPDAQVSLVYAYMEAEQQAEANALADTLARNTPKLIYQGMRGLEAPNPEYGRIDMLKALLDMYGDRLAAAEKRLAELRALAPFNAEIRSAWASLQSARDHPRAALDEFSLLLTDEPKSLDAAVGRAEIFLTLNQFAQAKAESQRLSAQQPDNRAVQNLARKIRNYDRPYFKVETVTGRGSTASGAESVYDAALYSAPLSESLGERYRVFSHLTRAEGHVGDEYEAQSRLGVGVDYRDRDFAAEAEVNRMLGVSAGGVVLALSWDLSDAWRGRIVADTNVNDLPAAAMRNGLKAESIKLSLAWSLNESRQAGGELSRMRFSDGNVRDASQLWWKERWLSGAKFKLDSVLGLFSSTNSLSGRDYFNPSRDNELSFSLNGEWLSWRRYQRAFKQRVGLTLGQYWQGGFDPGTVADLHYEHEWSRDDVLGVKYGIGRSFHPYDGNREYRSYLYLNLFGRIQ